MHFTIVLNCQINKRQEIRTALFQYYKVGQLIICVYDIILCESMIHTGWSRPVQKGDKMAG